MMSSLKLGAFELRRFKGTLPRIAIAFLAIVPLMYGLLYLWSNWDPYGKMDRIPAAVVNLDQPAQALGKTVDAGAQLVTELQTDPVLDWHFPTRCWIGTSPTPRTPQPVWPRVATS